MTDDINMNNIYESPLRTWTKICVSIFQGEGMPTYMYIALNFPSLCFVISIEFGAWHLEGIENNHERH